MNVIVGRIYIHCFFPYLNVVVYTQLRIIDGGGKTLSIEQSLVHIKATQPFFKESLVLK